MEKITFYTNPMSRGRIVRWMLEETELAYDTVVLEYEQMKQADYLAINPMGKVPVIKHGTSIITETAAICTYLADLVPEKKLAPALGTPERGSYYRWLFFISSSLEYAMFNEKILKLEISPDMRKGLGYGSFDLVFNCIENQLKQQPYLCGEQFSTADLLLAAMLNFGINKFKAIDARPAYLDYIEKIQARSAFKRAEQIDNSLLKNLAM